jgi:uncharacterized DUF497 family protein
MQFEWDERKRQTNIRKHGFDFRDAAQVFNFPMLVALDDREDYGEDRWIGIGMLKTQVVIIVYTERDEKTIRIISMMKALTHERIRYEQLLRDQLGND